MSAEAMTERDRLKLRIAEAADTLKVGKARTFDPSLKLTKGGQLEALLNTVDAAVSLLEDHDDDSILAGAKKSPAGESS